MTPSSACIVSETGRREVNQDRACAEPTTVSGEVALLMAVADGMGGMRSGDRAAEIAIETVREYAQRGFGESAFAAAAADHALWEMFQEANRRVWQWAQREGCAGEMGTTLACCLVFGNRYVVAHTGDSRCYYINDHEVRLLTEDHSRVQDMVRQELMTPEAARRSPFRNELTDSLGEPGEIKVDIQPGLGRCGVIDEPCVLLVTSDGVHGHVSDDDILSAIRSTQTVPAAGASLVSMALAQGSTDNVTLTAVECGQLRSRVIGGQGPDLAHVVQSPVTVKLRRTTVRPARRRTRRGARVLLGLAAAGCAAAVLSYPEARRAIGDLLPTRLAAWMSPTSARVEAVAPTVPSAPTDPGAITTPSASTTPTAPAASPVQSATPSQPTTPVPHAVAQPVAPALAATSKSDVTRDPGPTPSIGEGTWKANLSHEQTTTGIQLAWAALPPGTDYWIEFITDPAVLFACGTPITEGGSSPTRLVPIKQASFLWKPKVSGRVQVRVVARTSGSAAERCSSWQVVDLPGK